MPIPNPMLQPCGCLWAFLERLGTVLGIACTPILVPQQQFLLLDLRQFKFEFLLPLQSSKQRLVASNKRYIRLLLAVKYGSGPRSG